MSSPVEPIIPDFNRVAGAWQKWEEWLRPSYASFNQNLLQSADIQTGDRVLDLGCGSGSFAMLEANRVGPSGKVIGIDISNEMLQLARKSAKENGITNIEFQNQDAESLTFPDGHFDAITARFCLMFLKSPQITLQEIRRILKQDATFVACVWGSPSRNPMPRSVLERYIEIPNETLELPGPFRFGSSGALVDLMHKAGFQNTVEQEIEISEIFTDGCQYAKHLIESSGTWGGLLLKLEPEKFKQAMKAIIDAADRYRADDHLEIPRCAFIVSAR